ncbi:type II toxin-antitoxin system HicB family antitoxin [Conexibacter sp. JD483]|uniref:type II toxin-antitoxin system HicB family antitoxin n=1 Tax=unclassified Conexibacter TaxID=2627773 RepID=UPI002715A1EC|nr:MULTISPECIES: type II toxin-antitoxin system HicB family antitoxin [unclassified Conexibacter]MDO8186053.1 type II toxin-antitoxin system HicB family antitoxin [Conexibacter sp. CPCC 205706]MDO8199543.1 type II toxin-antitoxin system HicB family antitoxin [Conexibacter sp. CPCC 205762]MDR9368922.1 type II toxin-antitoxin system HicB family antitoxin [Conexibacter sp. JD483]
MPSTKEIPVKIHFEDGSMWATVDDMPGVFATGDTLEELRGSLSEGISLYLAENGQDAPPVDVTSLAPAETHTQAALAC